MRTIERPALTYDAGREREWLAETLARWQAAEWMPGEQAWRFHRRLGRLARALKTTRDELLDDLRQDAELIVLE